MSNDFKEQMNFLLQLGKDSFFPEAERLLKKIIKETPENAEALSMLGSIKFQNKQYKSAAKYIQKAIKIKPCADFYKKFGRVYIEDNDFNNAIKIYRKAIELEPDNFEVWFYLGVALENIKHFDEALIAYQTACSINSENNEIYRKLGYIYYIIKNDPQKAIKCYEKLAELLPEKVENKVCLALSYLKTKKYKEGWKYFEQRPNKQRIIAERSAIDESLIPTKPVWQGEDIKDKIIYVYYEGGLGDTFMFSRFLPLLNKKCAKVLFRPQMESTELFKENNLDTEVLEIKNLENEISYDFHIPMMSLPYFLNINKEGDIPYKDKYIKANSQKVSEYKKKFFNNNKFKIGIKWEGETSQEIKRKIMLKSFYKLFELPNTKFYSLQKGNGIEQLQEAKDLDIVDLGSTFENFSDTAAAIENLDLVISNDSSVAHLAGAMGKKCLILLPFTPDWRWTVDTKSCVWYNSVKLFKQKETGNWYEVFERVYSKLEKRLV